jgi:hypothetical protein
MQQEKAFLLTSPPVAILTGNEFAKKEGVTLTQQVTEYYNSIGNKAVSPIYGEVILDEKGVDDDFAHGVGRTKAIAFAAVPQVIERGIVILPMQQHKRSLKVESAMIAAPIAIADEIYVCVVVIRYNKIGETRLYVHEVWLQKKLLEPLPVQGVAGLSPAGSSNPTSMLATHQGDIAKVIQKILNTK